MAAVLYQKIQYNLVEPLWFSSERLYKAQINWIIFSRELLALYISAKHFSYFLQGINLTIQTNHQAKHQRCCQRIPWDIPREVRHVHYRAAIPPNWQHIAGSNITAYALSYATTEKLSPAATTTSPTATNTQSTISKLFFINVSDKENSDYKPIINSVTNTLKHHQYEALIAHQKNDPELKQLIQNSDSAEENK